MIMCYKEMIINFCADYCSLLLTYTSDYQPDLVSQLLVNKEINFQFSPSVRDYRVMVRGAIFIEEL